MDRTPKVSVITPAYNAESFIGQSIESILNQTFHDFEYIIIDDTSTDRTWEIIQEYAKKDNRIIALKNEDNLGIAGNRNKGIRYSRGEYIAWQDADDISMPTRLEKQVKLLDSHEDVGIVGGFLYFFREGGHSGIRKYSPDDHDLRRKIFRYSPVAQPVALIRKKCFDEVGEYDLRYPPAEDIDMSFRIGDKYKFANIQEVLLHYREHPNSATFQKLKKIETSTIELRKKYATGHNYRMTIADRIYNFLQNCSIYLIPPKLKIKLFNLLRNSYR